MIYKWIQHTQKIPGTSQNHHKAQGHGPVLDILWLPLHKGWAAAPSFATLSWLPILTSLPKAPCYAMPIDAMLPCDDKICQICQNWDSIIDNHRLWPLMAIVGMFWSILAQWLSLLSRCLFLCKLSLESPVMSKVMSVLDERLKQPWVTQMYQECPTVSNSVRFFNMQMFSFSAFLPIYAGYCGIPGHNMGH